jgi:mRNA-degrading endonuclease toxin of MazEF toxin-antitoxin module
MESPQRREIWWVKLGRRKQGTEIGANDTESIRACLVVSADDYNEDEDCDGRITIVPLTDYREGKEDTRSLWAVAIRNREDVDKNSPNARHPRNGKLSEWKSIIDCGQIWTIYAVSPTDLRNDVLWGRHCGELKEEQIIRVEAALQALVGGGIRHERKLPVREGHVLDLDLPLRPHQQCLVVSSPAIDAIREEMWSSYHKRRIGHCTVVPLVPASLYKDGDRGVTLVDVYHVGDRRTPEMKLAMCQEIYTVDWRNRLAENTDGPVGHVRLHQMDRVHEALRDYLDLPK